MLRIICPLHSYHQLQRVTQNYQFWEGFKNVIFDGSLFAPSFFSIPNAYVYLFLLGSMCQGLGCLSVLSNQLKTYWGPPKGFILDLRGN